MVVAVWRQKRHHPVALGFTMAKVRELVINKAESMQTCQCDAMAAQQVASRWPSGLMQLTRL